MSSGEMDGKILEQVERLAQSWIEEAERITEQPLSPGHEIRLRSCAEELLKTIRGDLEPVLEVCNCGHEKVAHGEISMVCQVTSWESGRKRKCYCGEYTREVPTE